MEKLIDSDHEQRNDFDLDQPFITETADIPFLVLTDMEDAANDNIPAIEGLNGCIWRDTETLRHRAGADDDREVHLTRTDEASLELDFSSPRTSSRGFLDDNDE